MADTIRPGCVFCGVPHTPQTDDSAWEAYGLVRTIPWADGQISAGEFFFCCDGCDPLYVNRAWAELMDSSGRRLSRVDRRMLVAHWNQLAAASVHLEPEEIVGFAATFAE